MNGGSLHVGPKGRISVLWDRAASGEWGSPAPEDARLFLFFIPRLALLGNCRRFIKPLSPTRALSAPFFRISDTS